MKYNFDELVVRRNTGCVKWDSPCPVLSGSATVVPGVSPSVPPCPVPGVSPSVPPCPVLSGSATESSPAPSVLSGFAAEPSLIPLWVADMDFAVAPAIQEAVRHRAEHPVFGYTHVQPDYYDAVISWFHRRHQWDIRREWILYTTGVVPAMSVAIKALTMPGERVLILSPDYNCFFSSIRNNGCEVAESRLLRFPRANGPQVQSRLSRFSSANRQSPSCMSLCQSDENARFSIDWPDFEAQCADDKTTVFLLCNPHNPTGRVWTRDELQRMADICHKHHVRIVSDEIHCELIMPGHTFVPMGTVDPEAIILNSPSKSFNIAGLQMANIICQDAAIRRRLDRAININEVCDVNPFAPEAVKAAYNDSEDWLDALNLYLWDNYRSLCDFVAQHLPQWHVMPLEGTYLVWVDVSAVLSSCSVCCDSPAGPVPGASPSVSLCSVPSGFAAGPAAVVPSGFAAGPVPGASPSLPPCPVPSGFAAGPASTVRFDSVETYCSHLLEHARVWLNPGTMYGPQSGEGYVRINIACPRSLLMEALERISVCP